MTSSDRVRPAAITARGWGWWHAGRTRPAVRGLDLDIQAGERVLLLGPSGAGKSTLMQLLTRFYEPQQGTITIDALDIAELKLPSLRSHIGVVTQETYLFHDTIANNLKYGKLDATD
ncbi:MAG: ATP-binding cassette domain-containing protein, partial [Arthrobacter sp.]